MENKIEKRFSKIEIRAKEDNSESRTIRGYAAVFNSDTQIGDWFIERIEKGAFDDVLKDDVRVLFNHDPNLILSRSGAGLTIGVDDTGLYYEFDAPDTTAGNDLLYNIRNGLIKESSFSFTVKSEKWEDKGKGKPSIRTILKFERLYDVSPVTYPAYADTTVATRSKKQFDDTYQSDLAEMDQSEMKASLQRGYLNTKQKSKV
ncbi:MAG TPA: HK97 family phage prohead protease [Chryseosolibacter sp.]|nr:HK97 family phage prohead protease [Chryseosolibacter sp.]